MNTVFYSHPACRRHDMGEGHPECPARLDAITDHLRATGLDIALDFREAPEARTEQLARAHAAGYVAGVTDVLTQVRDSGEPRHLDPDTIACPETLAAALRAAGAAVAATDDVLKGTAKRAFCAVRPPGHHATRDEAMGFCFFNNVGAREALAQGGHVRCVVGTVHRPCALLGARGGYRRQPQGPERVLHRGRLGRDVENHQRGRHLLAHHGFIRVVLVRLRHDRPS